MNFPILSLSNKLLLNVISIYTGTGVLFIYVSQRSLENVRIYEISLRLRQKLHFDENHDLPREEGKEAGNRENRLSSMTLQFSFSHLLLPFGHLLVRGLLHQRLHPANPISSLPFLIHLLNFFPDILQIMATNKSISSASSKLLLILVVRHLFF